jgi:RIO kinase 1
MLDDGVIDDVRARLMSGKEAAVFIVERRGELIAAKVYKDRDQRTFKATASYTEGRNQTRNTRDKRAMGKRSSYGKELVEASWRDMEYQALQEAFMNGVRVPEPFLLYESVLLMELLVDETGAPAPRLADFELSPEVATLLHREIYGQVRLLLRCGKIHGDLSAFNILVARHGPTLIDLPQVVDASMNNSAPTILQRDLQNVTEHLARFDSRLLRFRDCGSVLWHHYQRGEIDRATEPEEGGVRRHDARGHKGRRAREAERGRAGRGANERINHDQPRAQPRPQQQQQQRQQQQQQQQRQRQQPPPQRQEQPREHEHAREQPRANEQRGRDSTRTNDQRPNDQRPHQRPSDQRPTNDQGPTTDQRSNGQRSNDQRSREPSVREQHRPQQRRDNQPQIERREPQIQRRDQNQRPTQRRDQPDVRRREPEVQRREPQVPRRDPQPQDQRRPQPQTNPDRAREQPREPARERPRDQGREQAREQHRPQQEQRRERQKPD